MRETKRASLAFQKADLKKAIAFDFCYAKWLNSKSNEFNNEDEDEVIEVCHCSGSVFFSWLHLRSGSQKAPFLLVLNFRLHHAAHKLEEGLRLGVVESWN